MVFKMHIIDCKLMQLSKPFNFEDNLFTDHPSQEDPSLQLPPFTTHEVHNETIPLLHDQDIIPNPITQMKFYQEFKKIYSVSFHLHIQKLRLTGMLKELQRKIATIESTFTERKNRMRENKEKDIKNQENSSEQNRGKRSRRADSMLEKKYKCNIQYCERFYSSEGSLQQHIKLKHPQVSQESEYFKEESEELIDSF